LSLQINIYYNTTHHSHRKLQSIFGGNYRILLCGFTVFLLSQQYPNISVVTLLPGSSLITKLTYLLIYLVPVLIMHTEKYTYVILLVSRQIYPVSMPFAGLPYVNRCTILHGW